MNLRGSNCLDSQVSLACCIGLLLLAAAGCTESPYTAGAGQVNAKPTAEYKLDVEVVRDGFGEVVVTPVGASDGWFPLERIDDANYCRKVLGFYLASKYNSEASDKHRAPPMLGSYALLDGALRFRTAFPLVPGEQYVARFNPAALSSDASAGGTSLEQRYTAPNTAGSAAVPHLTTLYPTADELPANHLKFYLVFDQPMQSGDVFDYLRLDDLTTESEVTSPFRLTELWSRDGRRLTLWFHPGRQKQGVNLNVELGPVLQPGHKYRLVVSKAWTSSDGAALEHDVEKTFTAVAPDHAQPSPADWTLTIPSPATRKPLECAFPEPLDYALLGSELHVENKSGRRLAGQVEIAPYETAWRFTPDAPWQPGSYRLAIGAVVEDLAGNSIERPFERDVAELRATTTEGIVYLPFEID